MSDPDLPPDLAAPGAPAGRPPAGRAIARTRPRGCSPPAGPRARPPPAAGGWRRWAGVAAAVLLGINLSMSVAADTDWRLDAGGRAGAGRGDGGPAAGAGPRPARSRTPPAGAARPGRRRPDADRDLTPDRERHPHSSGA